MTSLRTPKTHRNLKKTEKGASRNGAEKTLKTNTQNEPVLAMEREARLKEEREPNESQKILNDPKQRPQQKVTTSQEQFQNTI